MPNHLKILYVEDDAVNAFVICKMLEAHRVDVAENCEACFKRVAETEYDLVLMDINLGDSEYDGIYCMKELRKRGYASKPIIAVTAYAMFGDRDRFLKEGFDDYYSKPVQKKQLIKSIEERFHTY